MIALQIPDDPDGAEMMLASEVKGFLFDLRRHFARMFVRHRSAVRQSSLPAIGIGFAPSVKAPSPYAEIPARLTHISDLLGMLQNPKFASDFALTACH